MAEHKIGQIPDWLRFPPNTAGFEPGLPASTGTRTTVGAVVAVDPPAGAGDLGQLIDALECDDQHRHEEENHFRSREGDASSEVLLSILKVDDGRRARLTRIFKLTQKSVTAPR